MTRESTAGVSAPEHHVSTQAQVVDQQDDDSRTRRLVSRDMSVVPFRAWLERDVRVKPLKDSRLSDDWLPCAMNALLCLSPDASWKNTIQRQILR